MDRLLLALAIVAVAGVAALVVRRRRNPDAPTQTTHEVPSQLDRADFVRLVDETSRDAEWMVVVFTSATCHTCADMAAKAKVLASRNVAVVEVEFNAERDLHARYRIDAVPTTVIVDGSGVVRSSFLGRVSATDLWAEVAEVREPGSRPPHAHD
jgi:thioredoxin-like negative regulator of GroEL